MNATQEHLLKLLLEIDNICKKHDIVYFLDYGTMLGAIRHEGFVPWDADVDITMTQDNYDRFKKVCESELDHRTRTFCDNRMNREFPTVYGHYVDLETCRMSGHTAFWDNLCGQSIDVFCLLELPRDEKEKTDFINRFYAYDEYCNGSFRHFRIKSEPVMELYRNYQELGEKTGKDEFLRQLEREIFGKKFENCDTLMAASARGFDPTPFVPKEAYDTFHKVMFEGHELTVPGGYGDLLMLYYGDDFNLFPTDPKKYSDMSHNGIPCRAYVDDFMAVVDKDQMLDDLLRFKNIEVEEGYRMTKIQTAYYQALAIRARKVVERDTKKRNLNVNAIIESGDREQLLKLNKVFNGYLTKQLNRGVLYWRIHFDMGDDLEYAAMYLLFMVRNDRKSIDKLFRLREENGLPLTDKMAEMKEHMTHIRNIKKYLLYKDYQRAKEELDWALDHYPDSREIETYHLQYITETAESISELDNCIKQANLLIEKYGIDIYFKKAIGDVYYKSGDFDKAEEIYDEIKETSKDGLILLDISKKEKRQAGASDL